MMMNLRLTMQDFLDTLKKDIREQAEILKQREMPALTEDLFALFENTGNRIRYESVYFERRKFLSVYGMISYLEKQEYGTLSAGTKEKLIQIIKGICREECWALPAHVNRSENPRWSVTVDLFAAETAQTLADLADHLRADIGEDVYGEIAENADRRVLQPFFDSPVPYGQWEHADHNWNAVCAGSIGSVCLHLKREDAKELEKKLKRICQALTHYIAGFSEDGACLEGLGYYTYGMNYFVHFAGELYQYTGGKQDLLKGEWGPFTAGGNDKRRRIASFQNKCFFPDGRTVSFSDGNSHDTFRVGLSCALALYFPEVSLPDMSRAAAFGDDHCFRFVPLKMDMLVTEKYLKEKKAEESSGSLPGKVQKPAGTFVVLEDAGWCIGKAENGVGFACKGGHNGEPHNHNDIGHFIYEAGGVFLLTDLGAGEYTKEYFSQDRYSVFCNHSDSHSVPVINGKGQEAGVEYACRQFEANSGEVRLELAGAYAEGLLDSLKRTFSFDPKSGELSVEDAFRLPSVRTEEEGLTDNGIQDDTLTENLVTQIPPQIKDNTVILEHNGVKAILVTDRSGMDSDISVVVKQHSNHSGIQEAVYQIRWQVKKQAGYAASRWKINVYHEQDRFPLSQE